MYFHKYHADKVQTSTRNLVGINEVCTCLTNLHHYRKHHRFVSKNEVHQPQIWQIFTPTIIRCCTFHTKHTQTVLEFKQKWPLGSLLKSDSLRPVPAFSAWEVSCDSSGREPSSWSSKRSRQNCFLNRSLDYEITAHERLKRPLLFCTVPSNIVS